QDFMNILTAITNFEHLSLVARALAFFANQLHIREKLHFHRNGAIALTRLAAASGDIKRKMTRGHSTLLSLRQRGKKLADGIESLDVSDWIRSRRPPDR